MAEAVVVTILGVSGAGGLRALGLRSPVGIFSLAVPIGVFAYLVVGAILVMARLPAYPVVAVGVVAASAAILTVTTRPTPSLRSSLGWATGTFGLFAASAVLVRIELATLTVDSFAYLTSTGILANHGSFEHASGWLMLKRGFAIPYLHALGHVGDGELALSVTPLLAISGCLAMVWIGTHAWRRESGGIPLEGWVLLVAIPVAIGTMPRFVFSATYVHTHLLFAVATLIFAGMAWLSVSTGRYGYVTVVACALSSVVLTLVRADGAIFAALLMVPLVATPAITAVYRVGVSAFYGSFTVGWNTIVGSHNVASDGVWRAEAWGLALVGVIVLVGSLVVWRFPGIARRQAFIVHGTHVALWGVLGVFAARDPGILMTTVRTSWENVVSEGLWGPSLFFLVAIVFIALLRSNPVHRMLWFPALTFVPFWLLLTYLREGAYRVGPGDSGTRMLLHVVLLAGLWAIAAIPTVHTPRAASVDPQHRVEPEVLGYSGSARPNERTSYEHSAEDVSDAARFLGPA